MLQNDIIYIYIHVVEYRHVGDINVYMYKLTDISIFAIIVIFIFGYMMYFINVN